MRSHGLGVSDKAPLAVDLNLPVFTEPMREWWPSSASWSEAMRAMALFRDYYLEHFDSPEKRLQDKENTTPFRLP